MHLGELPPRRVAQVLAQLPQRVLRYLHELRDEKIAELFNKTH